MSNYGVKYSKCGPWNEINKNYCGDKKFLETGGLP